jgi:hypothetical protein
MPTSGRAAEAALATPFEGHAGFAGVAVALGRASVGNDRSKQVREALSI